MRRKATTALATLLIIGTASVVLADTNPPDYYSLFAQRPVSMMSNGRTGAVNDAAKPFTTEEEASFAASQLALVQSAPSCRGGITGRTMPWIKLTEPGGKLIHINVEQVTSIRSDTQIPGARAQLDLVSGKFQGVQENVEQVMQLISATSGVRENDETPSAALIR
jgi:hypothetical protein